MRLVTRSDFDGLACGVLLKYLGVIDSFKFVHPKDMQDGTVAVTSNDVLANVPYVPGCGVWFDHHASEVERLGKFDIPGAVKMYPSCARVVWEYYGGREKFGERFDELMDAVDKVDSGSLSHEDVLDPKGWVLLGYVMDPRTGLGRYRDYKISNYQLMEELIDHCADKSVADILELPDVKERTARYFEQETEFRRMLQNRTKQYGNVVLIDLREQEEILSGNRFTVYSMFPDCNVSVQVIWGLKKQNVVITVGHSILNRSCRSNVGKLMLKYGGGGHERVGTCQVPVEKADEAIRGIVETLHEKK